MSTILDKSHWDTDVMQQIICVLQLMFEKTTLLSFEKHVAVSPQNLSYKIKFDLDENESVGGTHFHMNGSARKLVLAQRQKPTSFQHYIRG